MEKKSTLVVVNNMEYKISVQNVSPEALDKSILELNNCIQKYKNNNIDELRATVMAAIEILLQKDKLKLILENNEKISKDTVDECKNKIIKLHYAVDAALKQI